MPYAQQQWSLLKTLHPSGTPARRYGAAEPRAPALRNTEAGRGPSRRAEPEPLHLHAHVHLHNNVFHKKLCSKPSPRTPATGVGGGGSEKPAYLDKAPTHQLRGSWVALNNERTKMQRGHIPAPNLTPLNAKCRGHLAVASSVCSSVSHLSHPLLPQLIPEVRERQQVILVLLDELPLGGLSEVPSSQNRGQHKRERSVWARRRGRRKTASLSKPLFARLCVCSLRG